MSFAAKYSQPLSVISIATFFLRLLIEHSGYILLSETTFKSISTRGGILTSLPRRSFMKSLLGSALLPKASSLLAFQNPIASPAPDPSVKKVLVAFKCHFDAGFQDTQAAISQRFFKDFFPKAIQTASQLRASGGKERYVWTTGSWLLYEFLEQASPEERRTMEKAISDGDIAWHALPFTWQTELMTPSLIAGGLSLTQSLDKRFGRKTTGAKMTDVPGHTRGLVSPLASNGVTFLEIGVNDASTPAELPPLFNWKDTTGATLTVMYHHHYGAAIVVPGSDLAVATVVRDDDSGPHALDEIHDAYADLAKQFPNAEIVATDLTHIAEAIAPHAHQLPVISQEIGDTWIHGVASDPLKLARYREVARLRDQWLAEKKFALGDATDLACLRRLLLEVEHTWGTDTKTWLDFDHYTPNDLASMLDTKNYKVVAFSWREKRQDLTDAVATLPASLRTEAESALRNLQPTLPKLTKPRALSSPHEIENAHFIVGLDPATGSIRRLLSKKQKREWASANNPLALFSYQTLSQSDYAEFFRSYVISEEDWAKKDFGKPNIERFGAQSQDWTPSVVEVHLEKSAAGARILAQLKIDDPESIRSGRAAFPAKLYLELSLPESEPAVHLTFSWFNKRPTRMPEAMWLTFHPIVTDPNGWLLEKSGQPLSPTDVVSGGNRHMHALSKGFQYRDANGSLAVETIDAPLVALGKKSPLYFSKAHPDLSAGIHSNLFNNAWGTNYIMWFGEDMKFRYVLRA
jgi:hypothetical protein